MTICKKLSTNFFIVACLLVLVGCTSKPRKIVASLPLVAEYSTEKPNKVMVPEQYWRALSDPAFTQLNHPRYKVELSALYISALAQKCRQLDIVVESGGLQKRVACELHFENSKGQKDKAWFLEPEIVTSADHIEL